MNAYWYKRMIVTCVAATVGTVMAAPRQANDEAKLHKLSTTIEKERPQLNEETKALISAYHREPSEASRAALRQQVAKNYDAIVARKKANSRT